MKTLSDKLKDAANFRVDLTEGDLSNLLMEASHQIKMMATASRAPTPPVARNPIYDVPQAVPFAIAAPQYVYGIYDVTEGDYPECRRILSSYAEAINFMALCNIANRRIGDREDPYENIEIIRSPLNMDYEMKILDRLERRYEGNTHWMQTRFVISSEVNEVHAGFDGHDGDQ